MYYFFSNIYSYLIFILPALLLSLYAQAKVKGTYAKYGKMYNKKGLTGAMAA